MEESVGLGSYLQIILRRKWHFLVSFLTVVSLSFIFTFMLPKIYRSEATIMIEKRGRDAVKGIFEPARINTAKFNSMKAVIKSQGKLETLIKKLSLDKNLEGPLEYENLIKKIQRGLDIKMSGTNLFTISFTGREPRNCMRIVNAVSNFFVEQDINTLYGANYASFPVLNKLLAYYEKRVNKAHGALTKFKIENKEQMPGSLDKNFSKLEEYQVQLAANELNIRETSEKIKEIKRRMLGETKEPLPGLEQELTPEEQELKRLNQKLETLLMTYTDKHPMVIKLKSQIENQKRQLLESFKIDRSNQDAEDAANLQSPLLNPKYLKLRKLLQQTKSRLSSLEQEQAKLKEQITDYDEKVKKAPIKEQEYAALQRELKANQNIYESLLTKLERARLSKEMNLMERDIRFTVINAAPLPLSPISPKMSKNLVVGTVLGLFLGFCSAFWAEHTDHSLRMPKDVQNVLQVPLLATIPTVYTEAEMIKRRRVMILSFLAGGAYLMLLLILIARELIINYTPSLLYLQTYQNAFSRFLQAIGG